MTPRFSVAGFDARKERRIVCLEVGDHIKPFHAEHQSLNGLNILAFKYLEADLRGADH